MTNNKTIKIMKVTTVIFLTIFVIFVSCFVSDKNKYIIRHRQNAMPEMTVNKNRVCILKITNYEFILVNLDNFSLIIKNFPSIKSSYDRRPRFHI